MIVEYKRPKNLEEALNLLARVDPPSAPLAGGTALNRPGKTPVAVIDLQDLGLDTLELHGNRLELGATLTLQSMLEAEALPPALKAVIERQASYNLRQVATVGGTLMAADGRSPLLTAMLALDATLLVQPGDESLSLGDILPVRAGRLRGRLITQVSLPANVGLCYQYVARSPADLPVVCVAVAHWPSGRTRVALGGFGPVPRLAFDGTEPAGADVAAQSTFSQAQDDWASAEYRSQVAGVLTRRCLGAV